MKTIYTRMIPSPLKYYQDVCPNCGQSKAKKSSLCRSCSQLSRGENHYAWKGDLASETTKRHRAIRMYELEKCDSCSHRAVDRHHKDGDTGNNSPSNISLLCRRCHMEEDGRLERFRENALRNSEKARKPPQPCVICGRLRKPLRRGRCGACNEHLRRNGSERPVDIPFRTSPSLELEWRRRSLLG